MALPAPYTKEEVEGLDFFGAADLCERNGFSYEELTSETELKRLLLQKLCDASGAIKEDERAEKASEVLQKILEKDQLWRKELSDIYMEILNLLSNRTFDDTILKELNTEYRAIFHNYDNVIDMLSQYNSELVNDDCPIVVAGETGAGKSSFLNLLIGEVILPQSLLCATSTICQLMNSLQKRYEVRFEQADKEGKYTIAEDLHAEFSGEELRNKLNGYVNIRETEGKPRKVKEVRIFWPIPILQGNVSIVDTPGIGDCEEMTSHLLQFLPKAVAFIYIINSATAGGVQQDRLGSLFTKQKDDQDRQYLNAFDPTSAIFICNKWDAVPEAEKIIVEHNTVKKLETLWPSFQRNQMFTFSTTETVRCMKSGAGQTPLYRDLITGIKMLITRSLEIRIKAHHGFLVGFLQKLERSFVTRIRNSKRTKEEKQEMEEQVRERLNLLDHSADEKMESLKMDIMAQGNNLVNEMYTHLHSKEVMDKMKLWDDSDLPEGTEMDIIKFSAEAKIRKRIFSEIETWNKKNACVEHIYKKIKTSFMESFKIIDEQFQKVSDILSSDSDVETVCFGEIPELHNSSGPSMFGPRERLILGLTSPLWVPLALVATVLALPVIGCLAVREVYRNRADLNKYRTNKARLMADWAKTVLDQLTKDVIRAHLVDEQLKHFDKVWAIYHEEVIPRKIKADQELLQNLANDQRTHSTIVELYGKHHRKTRTLIGQTKFFRVKHFDGETFSVDDVIVGERIGFGSFANVYYGEWIVPEKAPGGEAIRKEVAIKVFNDKLSKQKAYMQLSEVDVLRCLTHPNIIKLFGIVYKEEQLHMVMELCEKTLEAVILKEADKVPAKHSPGSDKRMCAFEFYKSSTIQIINGLDYVHENRYVHRDLKLSNLLVNSNGVIKISDVGFCTFAEDITGTVRGTPTHLAPEVLQGKPYSQSCDIYSLSILLWEMWYGRQAYDDDDLMSCTPFDLMEMIAGGVRPNFDKGFNPLPELQAFLQRCWDVKPDRRPKCRECLATVTLLSDSLPESDSDNGTDEHQGDLLRTVAASPVTFEGDIVFSFDTMSSTYRR